MNDTLAEERPKRIQFEFSPEAFDRLNKMKEQTSASSYAEVVRDALRVYEWFNEQIKSGYDIGLVKNETLVKTVEFVF